MGDYNELQLQVKKYFSEHNVILKEKFDDEYSLQVGADIDDFMDMKAGDVDFTIFVKNNNDEKRCAKVFAQFSIKIVKFSLSFSTGHIQQIPSSKNLRSSKRLEWWRYLELVRLSIDLFWQ